MATRVCTSGICGCFVTRSSRITSLPFLTSEILALSPPVPLALHNYTTFANVLAFPLIPLLGVVQTFNVLVIASGIMSGYAMYFYARKRTGDPVAAWVGGLLFGFSPFMSARAAEHFSLTLAAPLPIFGWLMFRIYSQPTMGLACAAGATVAWAFLCDVYYAVYCLLWAGFMACFTTFSVETRPRDGAPRLAARPRRSRDRLSRRTHRRHGAARWRSGRRLRD